jgi:acyl-coenzyme A synthetase/AMP-(fatty) acid ligase
VALPAESVCLNAAAIAQSLQLGSHDRVAVTTPLGYMYGLVGGCLASLWAGGACRVFRPAEPPTRIQAAIRRENLTVVQGPPSLFRLFLAYWNGHPFLGVRLLTTGGEPMDRNLFEGLEQAFPNAGKLFLYGMTEAGPRISHLAFEQGGGRDSTIGFPYAHIEWRLEKIENTEGARLVFRGPGAMLGYIAPGGGYEGLDAEGFFHSNDLLEPTPDGRLRFGGRLDRIFRSGGRLVNPEAVERVLESLPSISAAFCHAEEHPLLGFVPVAEVVFHERMALDPRAILEACAPFIEPHSLPRKISVRDELPLAESGKRIRNPVPRGGRALESEAKRTSP